MKIFSKKGGYCRHPKNARHTDEAELGISSRSRGIGGIGGHPGKPVWAHGVAPFGPVTDETHMSGLVGLDRDQLAAVRGEWTKKAKKQKAVDEAKAKKLKEVAEQDSEIDTE